MDRESLKDKVKKVAGEVGTAALNEIEDRANKQKEIWDAEARLSACSRSLTAKLARMRKIWPVLSLEDAVAHPITKEVHESLVELAAEQAELEALRDK